MAQDIQLGDVARDSVTGFEGVVVAYCEWLNGCARLTVQPQKLQADGAPVGMQTFDLPQLELVRKAGHKPNRTTGGPRPEPAQAIAPR